MEQDLSIFPLLATQAGRAPEAFAILAPGRTPLRYGRLQAHVSDIVKTLNTMGVGRHDRVALVLLAIDQSKEMMRLVWPGDIEGRRRAGHGDWLRLPQPNGWFDLVVGDGCFSCMEYLGGYRVLAASLHRVLKKHGLLIMRFLVQPEASEKLHEVFKDLMTGRIGSFSALRWRLIMALQADPRNGVRMVDVWQAWVGVGIDWNTVVARTGWPAEAIHTLCNDDARRFSFPTLAEVRATLSDHFEAIAVRVAQYELAERCPTLVFRPL